MCTKTFGMFIYSFQGVKGLASLSCFGGSKTPKNRNKKQAMEGGGWCQSQFSPIFLPSSSLKKNKTKVPGIRPLLPALLHKLFLMLQSRFETAQDVSIARENYLKKTGIRGPFIYPFYCNTSKTRTTTRNRPGQCQVSTSEKPKLWAFLSPTALLFYPRKKMNMEPENQPLIGKQAKIMLQILQTSRKFGLQNVIRQPSRLNVLLPSPPPAYASGCHFLGRQRSFWLCPKNSYGFLSKSRRQKISRNYQKQLKFIQ